MNESRENETKRRIRLTAMQLFRERSFEEVTLRDICNASGVNRHTFYYYFKSKDELLERYYDFPWELSGSEAADILMTDSFVEQLWLITKKFVDFVERMGLTIVRQVLMQNMVKNVGTFRNDSRMRDLCKLQESIIEKGQHAKQFRNTSDAFSLMLLLQQTIHSTCFMWVIMDGKFDYHQHARYLFETLLDVAEEFRVMQQYDPHSYLHVCDKPASDESAQQAYGTCAPATAPQPL